MSYMRRELNRYSELTETLTHADELELLQRYQSSDDQRALDRLVRSHMRMALAAAHKFRHYGVDRDDLVQQGAMGLVRAAQRFDINSGLRFSTYARHEINGAIAAFVMSNKTVRTATTVNRRRVFFKLRAAKSDIGIYSDTLTDSDIAALAERLGVTEQDIIDVNANLNGDSCSIHAGNGDGGEVLDSLADDSEPADEIAARHIDGERACSALENLPARHAEIIRRRIMLDEPETLQQIADDLGISRERCRQIELQALDMLRDAMR